MRTVLCLVLFAGWIGPLFAAMDGPDHFAPKKLRGYGVLSGERMEAGPQSAVLRITAESVPKAQLLLAKYLSDLGELPGVTPLPLDTARGRVAARTVEGQGAIAAVRSGVTVSILSAPDANSLRTLIETRLPAGLKIDASDAEIAVPMFLDRWDKYGLRFYYCHFWMPPGTTSYDPAKDFQFAEDSGHSGIVPWFAPINEPYADGLLDFDPYQWVYRAGREHALPMGANIGFVDDIGFLRMRLPDDLAPDAPGFVGNWYGATNFGGGPTVAWSSDKAQEMILGQFKPVVQRLASENTLVNWLEPHEEMGRGITERLDDHGPTARENFHQFLREKYHTPEAVAARWSQPGAFQQWDDVPFPEVATFCGWDANAVDLTGEWKVSFNASYGVESAAPGLDDSRWVAGQAPGDALVTFLPRKPAVFRRHIQIDPAWHKTHPKVWLQCFDFNNTRPNGPTNDVLVFVNGKPVPENPPRKTETHWAALDVSDALVDGPNVITLCLPQALLCYRVYLTGTPPAAYPALGPRLNAMWADFTDWTAWSRGRAVRRGMQMIRQIDPDRPITLMTPDADLAPIKQAAEEYGGIIHDTGGMAGGWNDVEPAIAQSNGLATDCEPGSPAPTVDGPEGLKCFLGRWETEGTNGVDYFQNISDMEWKPEIRDYFTKTQNLWHLIGKYHESPVELAVFDSDRNDRLFGFPWDGDEVVPNLVDDIRLFPALSRLTAEYPRGSLIEQDFTNGNAGKFRVIIDSGTPVLDPATIDAIADWVRSGGVFIAVPQTGRHTSVLPNAWPISKLTGYAVTGSDKLAPNGEGLPNRALHVVSGQPVFDPKAPAWQDAALSAGLSLEKANADCEDLLQWGDGSIAAGMRKLGKGTVFVLGSNSPTLPLQVFKFLGLCRVPIESSDASIIARHFVSNNGLYDVWSMWNQSGAPVSATMRFRDGVQPASARDVNSGSSIPVDADPSGAKFSNVHFDAWETHVYLSPRRQLALAASNWFVLQRGWWSGTANPGKPVPDYHSKDCVDLTDEWALKLLPGTFTGTPPEDRSLADPALDNSSWPRAPFEIFDCPDNAGVNHAFLRKTFTVPAGWTQGTVRLFARPGGQGNFREYLDGKPYTPAVPDDPCGGILKPGSRHCLVVESWNDAPAAGPDSPVFLSYQPNPIATQAINGWAYAPDCLKFSASQPTPVTTSGGGALRATVKVPAMRAGRTVLLHVGANCDALIVNGHALRGGYSNVYPYFDANVTPWVRFGADNIIVAMLGGRTVLPEAQLRFYDPVQYP